MSKRGMEVCVCVRRRKKEQVAGCSRERRVKQRRRERKERGRKGIEIEDLRNKGERTAQTGLSPVVVFAAVSCDFILMVILMLIAV
jgi:hypothetical protein